MTPTISFRVALLPRPWARARAQAIPGRGVRFFPLKEQEDYQHSFLTLAAPHAPSAPLEGPLAVTLVFDLPFLGSWPRWKTEIAQAQRLDHESKPDLDNYIKNFLDALTRSGAWWRDDAQVSRLTASKGYAAAPGTTVTIEQIEQPTRPARGRSTTAPSQVQPTLFPR